MDWSGSRWVTTHIPIESTPCGFPGHWSRSCVFHSIRDSIPGALHDRGCSAEERFEGSDVSGANERQPQESHHQLHHGVSEHGLLRIAGGLFAAQLLLFWWHTNTIRQLYAPIHGINNDGWMFEKH